MVYHFRVHREAGGYWAECVELTGCSTQADTVAELAANAQEALELYLEEPEDSQLAFALPQVIAEDNILDVPVDPGVALSVVLRNYRIQNQLTQKQVADKLGMRNLYSYQRLERKSNPSLETLGRLKEVFPDLSVDYVLKR